MKFIPLSLLIYNLDSRTIDDVTNGHCIRTPVRNYVGLRKHHVFQAWKNLRVEIRHFRKRIYQGRRHPVLYRGDRFETFTLSATRGSGGCSKNPVTEKPGKREGKRGWMDGWYRQWFLDSAIKLAGSFFQFALMPWNRAGKNESNRLYK